ncbi:MAG: extracellular solute-binding protein [Spirochaetales bacterium]|nr:extracellular solute-binding protein [Spirochaetales bacterium]
MQDQSNINRFFNEETTNFRKIYPDIEIDIEYIPWHMASGRIIQCIKEKSGPDIIQIGSTWFRPLLQFDSFMDLNDEFKDVNEKNFASVALSVCRPANENRLLAVPWFLDIRGLNIYRKAMDAAGINPDLLKDHLGFMEACRLAQKSFRALNCVRSIGILILHDLSPWIWNFGGDFFTEDGTDILLDSEPSVAGMDYYFSLIHEFEGKQENVLDSKRLGLFFNDPRHVFCSGELGPAIMFFKKDSDRYNARIAGEYAVASLPAGPAASYVFAGGSCLAVMNYTQNRDMAIEFLRFLLRKETQYSLTLWTGFVPCLISAFDEVCHVWKSGKQVLTESLEKAHMFPSHHLWPTIEGLISGFCANVMRYVNTGSYTKSILVDELETVSRQIRYIIRQ